MDEVDPRSLLSLEKIDAFTPDHLKAVAGIEAFEHLLIDARKNPFDAGPPVAALRERRPGLDVQVAGPDAKGPPRPGKK